MSSPFGGDAAVTVTAAAGAPRPTGTGTNTSSATPTQTATAVATPPTARLPAGDRRREAANRNGFSTRYRVSTARPAEKRAAASLPARPSGWPSNGGASSNTGQCHRYHEYDTRPTARIGAHASTRPHPRQGAAQPAPITRAVPRTGNKAALPG